MKHLPLAALVAFAAGCYTRATDCNCDTSDDCTTQGQICVSCVCRDICIDNYDCDADERCESGACLPAAAGGDGPAPGDSAICPPAAECSPEETESRSCGPCAQESRTCTIDCEWGEWGSCEAGCTPDDVETQSCGNCGSQSRICDQECVWGEWTQCAGEGVCAVDAQESQPCGGTGTQERICLDDCAWSDWTACSAGCTPQEVDTRPCGHCGSQTRVCLSDSTWDDWGACTGERECAASARETRSCGNCDLGTESRVCDAECTWGDWSTCTGGGECAATATDSRPCGNCNSGTETRTCNAICTWDPWGACTGASGCTPHATQNRSCGNCNRGTETRTCRPDTCTWGSWSTCVGGGECALGTTGGSCGQCGRRRCDGDCNWYCDDPGYVRCWADADGDGHCADDAGFDACSCSGCSSRGDDCNDGSRDQHPGAGYSTSTRNCPGGGWECNCNGSIDKNRSHVFSDCSESMCPDRCTGSVSTSCGASGYERCSGCGSCSTGSWVTIGCR